MGRPVVDQMPQKVLTYELKRAIDVARNSDPSSTAWELAVGRIMHLCRENPASTLREHVLHNLGCGRRRWLRQLSTTLRASNTSIALHLDLMGMCRRDRVAEIREALIR